MSENNLEVYLTVLENKIRSKVTIETEKGCQLWRTRSDYPKMVTKFPGQDTKTMYVHRLIMMIKMKVDKLPTTQEVSHICHCKGCCNVHHLNLKPHFVNMERIKCQSLKMCSGHEQQPGCII